jgi:hypothetical protein
MATPLFSTGFEHQAPFTTNGGGLYSLVLGTWTIDTSIKHTGNAAAKVAVASGAAADIRSSRGISGTAAVQSVYVNFGRLSLIFLAQQTHHPVPFLLLDTIRLAGSLQSNRQHQQGNLIMLQFWQTLGIV